jgi:hypothetical protein
MDPTDAERELAALLMSACASNPEVRTAEVYDTLRVTEGVTWDAYQLGCLAWLDVDGGHLDLAGPNDPCRDAEAEALLRCGWCP